MAFTLDIGDKALDFKLIATEQRDLHSRLL